MATATMSKGSLVITGATPILYNRRDIILNKGPFYSKGRGEGFDTVQERTWRDKAHYLKVSIPGEDLEDVEEGTIDRYEKACAGDKVIVPAQWLKMSLINTQKASGNPIKPEGAKRANDTMKQYFVSGISFDDDILLLKSDGKTAVTRKDLVLLKNVVTVPQGGSVACYRPLYNGWMANLTYTIYDAAITHQMVEDCMRWVGIYFGIGDWRPQHGGSYGRFTVDGGKKKK